MILPNMSPEEIYKEIKNDYEYVHRYALHQIKDNKTYLKQALKNEGHMMFNPFEYECPKSKNTYLIFPASFGKTQTKKHGLAMTIGCYFFGEKRKLNLAMYSEFNDSIIIFSSHMFDRYAERFMNGSDSNKKQLMIDFIKSNQDFGFSPITNPKVKEKYGDNSLMATTTDGVLLGNRINGHIVLLNTYITNEQLKGDEIQTAQNAQSNINKGAEEYMKSINPVQQVINKPKPKNNPYDHVMDVLLSTGMDKRVALNLTMANMRHQLPFNLLAMDDNSLRVLAPQIAAQMNIRESKLKKIISESIKKVLHGK